MRHTSRERVHFEVALRARDVDAQLASVRQFTPIELQAAVPLTNWMKLSELGEVAFSVPYGNQRGRG